MKKSWWTIDRIAMLIGLCVTLFGWGITWGISNTKIGSLEEDKVELERKVEKLEDENNDQEIKISLNTDAVGDVTDILRDILRARPEED